MFIGLSMDIHGLPGKYNSENPYCPAIGGKIVEMTLLNDSHKECQGHETDQCGNGNRCIWPTGSPLVVYLWNLA